MLLFLYNIIYINRKEESTIGRTARFLAAKNYYHVITRGNGKQILFEANDDYLYYLSLLQRYSGEFDVKICVYCLMNNHTHFLVYDENENLSLFMHKINYVYALYYNKKYDHVGHVFQDRFKSIIIENELQFLAVCKYILLNPERAEICHHSIYPWSSYSSYFTGKTFTSSTPQLSVPQFSNSPHRPNFVDQTTIYNIFHSQKSFYDFLSTTSDDKSMTYDPCKKYNRKKDDKWAQKKIKDILNIDSGTSLQDFSKNKRDIALRELKAAGLSIRQIERLTGISRNIIQRS